MKIALANGISLIEVLVSIVILGIGVVGFAGMQIQSLSTVNDAYYRTQAIAIAQDIIERIKANPQGWPNLYAAQHWQAKDPIVPPPCWMKTLPSAKGAGCAMAEDIARYDRFEVSQQLRVSLPNAGVYIQQRCSSTGTVSCIDVTWGDKINNFKCDVDLVSVEEVKEQHCVSVNFIAYQQL